MSDWDPMALYRTAQRSRTTMNGYYNKNVRVETQGGPVLVRIPLPRADQMDLRIWAESDVLRAVGPYVDRAPRLLHASTDPPFQVHEFIPGTQLNRLASRGTPVPQAVIPDVLALFHRLAAVPLDALPALPADWPEDGKCADFGHLLSVATRRVYDEHREEFGELFAALGIPGDPLATIVAAWPTLTPRPFRVLHADVHRRNILMSARGAVFLDWELALCGDAVYDLAVHVNKMTYLDDELRSLLTGWEAAAGRATARSWRADLTAYVRHEQVKVAIVHTIRYTKEIVAADTTDTRRAILVDKLTGNLNAAGPIWGRRTGLSAHDVTRAIATHPPRG